MRIIMHFMLPAALDSGPSTKCFNVSDYYFFLVSKSLRTFTEKGVAQLESSITWELAHDSFVSWVVPYRLFYILLLLILIWAHRLLRPSTPLVALSFLLEPLYCCKYFDCFYINISVVSIPQMSIISI